MDNDNNTTNPYQSPKTKTDQVTAKPQLTQRDLRIATIVVAISLGGLAVLAVMVFFFMCMATLIKM